MEIKHKTDPIPYETGSVFLQLFIAGVVKEMSGTISGRFSLERVRRDRYTIIIPTTVEKEGGIYA